MTFEAYLSQIENLQHKDKIHQLIQWALKEFPTLKLEMKWNQPMLLDHGTFIISFGFAKQHISVSPEKQILDMYRETLQHLGYKATKMLCHIKWEQDVPFEVIQSMIEETMFLKTDYHKFWL